MNIQFLFTHGQETVIIKGVHYSLEELRQNVLAYQEKRIKPYFVKCITDADTGKKRFIYDWEGYFTSADFDPWVLQVPKLTFDEYIRPIPGFTPDNYSTDTAISVIYRAIKKQFVLNTDPKINAKGKHQGHSPLEVHGARSLSKSSALAVFVGMIKMHNFDAQEAVESAGMVDMTDFKDNWRWFKQYIRDHITDIKTNYPDEYIESCARFHTKTRLVLSHIESSISDGKWVSLGDINF